MSTVRMWILAKMERARLKELRPARSKSREERPDAPESGAKGSHDRREKVVVAWRSGHGRKVGAVETAKAMLYRHSTTSPSGRGTQAGQGRVSGQLVENQHIARSNDRVLMSLPCCRSSNLAP